MTPPVTQIPALVLAGGLGTRLRGVINDLPKPMAPVNGKPFLHYLFLYLQRQQIKKVIVSVGYKSEVIENYFGSSYLGLHVVYSREAEPLGTGGGINKALELVNDFAFVLNGDTFFDIDLAALNQFYFGSETDISVALKPMKNFDRYGTVQLRNDTITCFTEKKPVEEGLINGGVYLFHKAVLANIRSQKFSFEREVLEATVLDEKIGGKIFNDYFIDIGVPEDYAKAQQDFKTMFA